jgi:hypothetical protein
VPPDVSDLAAELPWVALFFVGIRESLGLRRGA